MKEQKQAYWFRHDAHAQDDPKILKMVFEKGWEAYGLFWALVERLRTQVDYKMGVELIPILSRRLDVDAELLESIVNNYGLFETKDGKFYSESLLKRMEKMDKAIEASRRGGKKSAEARRRKNVNPAQTEIDDSKQDSKGTSKGTSSDPEVTLEGDFNQGEKRRKEKKRKDKKTQMAERIYSEYPRKVGKKTAIDKILKAMQEKDPEELLEIVKVFARSTTGQDKQYIPHPSTWFHQARYDDNPKEWTEWKRGKKAGQKPERPANFIDVRKMRKKK